MRDNGDAGTAAPEKLLGGTSALAIVGGVSWALLPFWDSLPGNGLANLLFFVLPPLLIAAALVGMHRLHKQAYGRIGAAGFALSYTGLQLVAVGNAVEVVSVASRGEENDTAHLVFFAGFFLVALPGAVLLGMGLRRAGTSPLVRLAGGLLVVTLTLSILFGFVGTAVAPPNTDVGFWLAVATPYGLTWMLIGVGLVPSFRDVRPAG